LFLWVRPRFAASGKPRNVERPRERIPATIWLVALLAFLCFSTEDSVRDWSALYLRNGLAAPLAQAAWGFAAYSACMGSSRFAGDWIRHHASDRTIVLSGGILAAIGFSIAGATQSYAHAIAGFALVGVGLSNIVPIFVSAAGRSPSPAAAVSLVVTLGYSGYLVSPPALGAIAGYASLASMFLVVGAVALFIGLAWLALSRSLPVRS
jgi:fucose permease